MRRLESRSNLAERGAVSIAVAFIVILLAGLSVGFLRVGLAHRQAVAHTETSMKALELAEKGLVQAEMELSGGVDHGADGLGDVVGTHAGGAFTTQTTQSSFSQDRWSVTATGTHGHSRRRVEVGLRRRVNSSFVEGLFARDWIEADGTVRTDAYDSRGGTYLSQAINADAEGAYAEAGGHLGSNGRIDLSGGDVHVRGNAIPGPLDTVTGNGGFFVQGDSLPRLEDIEVPITPLSEFQAALAVNNNLEVAVKAALAPANKVLYDPVDMSLEVRSQHVLTLHGGTYFFSSLKVRSEAVLRVDSPTKIYVTGNVDTSGGTVVNPSGAATDLQIFAHPYHLPAGVPVVQNPIVKVRGGVNFAVAIYAPEAAATIQGGTDVFGAVVANTISILGGGLFHYDRALGEVGRDGRARMERLYWRELSVPIR